MKIAFVFNKKTDDSVEQAEFDTPDTIAAIRTALESGGHRVIEVEMPREDTRAALSRRLGAMGPDIVFNTAEGYRGVDREGVGPAVFEDLGIPYVGSSAEVCRLTLDKALTKRTVAASGVRVVEGRFLWRSADLRAAAAAVGYPVFVKPNYEGSSKGISPRSVCRSPAELVACGAECLALFPEGILVERFIAGRDISFPFIAGLGDEDTLDPLEYTYAGRQPSEEDIYDYELKNVNEDDVDCHCPARLASETRTQLMSMMKRAERAVGVRDFGRADFRVSAKGEVFFLEMNALPSLQPNSGLFAATRQRGLGYSETILKILAAAMARYEIG